MNVQRSALCVGLVDARRLQFTATEDEGNRVLDRIASPPRGSSIVMDMSAMITLHGLDLLETACAYFEKIYVPSSYQAIWVQDMQNTGHHQASQVDARRAIAKAVQAGLISVKSEASSPAVLDEYEKDKDNAPCPVIRIPQLTQWLEAKGRLSAEQHDHVAKFRSPSSLVSQDVAESLLAEEDVLASPRTLITLHTYGLLDSFLAGINISLLVSDYEKVKKELEWFEERERAGCLYRDLEEKFRAIPNVEFSVVADEGGEQENAEITHDIHLGIDAIMLAMQMSIPLMVDDRSCQQGAFGGRPNDVQAAFGTDALLGSLEEAGMITRQEHARYFVQLVRWRYRFLVPSPELLVEMAYEHRRGLPGDSLRTVALYIQDCMLDYGLYAGPEKVCPPTPMAIALWREWINTLAKAISDIWYDSRFPRRQSLELVSWMLRCMLPVWPRNLPRPCGERIASLRHKDLLCTLLSNVWFKPNWRKAYQLLRFVTRTLPVDAEIRESALATTIEVLVSATERENWPELGNNLPAMTRVMYGDSTRFPMSLIPIAEKLGYVDKLNPPPDLPPEYTTALVDPANTSRLSNLPGPWTCVNYSGKDCLFNLLEALCRHNGQVRSGVLDVLLSEEHCPMSQIARSALRELAEDIRSDKSSRWIPAVQQACTFLKDDFILNLAAYRQTMAVGDKQTQRLSWAFLIAPTAEGLLHVDHDGWHPLFSEKQPAETLSAALESAPSFDEFLERYDQLAGHLSLAAPLGLGQQIKRYRMRHGALPNTSVWLGLQNWLQDLARPWRQYHAVQAILANYEIIPTQEKSAFWATIARLARYLLDGGMKSPATQLWALERELAAHYLQIIDLGNFQLEANRPVTVAWWAAREVVESLMSTHDLEKDNGQINQWRTVIASQSMVDHNSWMCFNRRFDSPARSATLLTESPRTVAMLMAIGEFAQKGSVEEIPEKDLSAIRTAMTMMLFRDHGVASNNNPTCWVWDHPLLPCIKTFLSSCPVAPDKDTEDLIDLLADGIPDDASLEEHLAELPSMKEPSQLVLCTLIFRYLSQHTTGEDVLWTRLRQKEWREKFVAHASASVLASFAQCIDWLQNHGPQDKTIEAGYVYLRMGETVPEDVEKVKLLLDFLLVSATAANTIGLLKSLHASPHWPSFQPHMERLIDHLEDLTENAKPSMSLRMQATLTVLTCG